MSDFTAKFADDGFLLLSRLFPCELIDNVRQEFERQFPLCEGSLPRHLEVGNKRVKLTPNVTGALLDPMLLTHPVLLRILQAFLGHNLLIDNLSCVVALPGAELQHLHRDDSDLFPDSRKHLPPYAITAAIPLVDFNENTGTTELYRGSHRLRRNARGKLPSLTEPKRPYLKRGDCLLFDYRIWHRGLPNIGTEPRPLLSVHFTRPWYTDSTNYHRQPRLRFELSNHERLTEMQRQLLRRLAAPGALDMSEEEWLGPSSETRGSQQT